MTDDTPPDLRRARVAATVRPTAVASLSGYSWHARVEVAEPVAGSAPLHQCRHFHCTRDGAVECAWRWCYTRAVPLAFDDPDQPQPEDTP